MPSKDTYYVTTDFDLRSPKPFDCLHSELDAGCCELHYGQSDDGTWWASYEANWPGEPPDRCAPEHDIGAMLAVVESLSVQARQEFLECTTRDFNLGFHCWDTWAYNLGVPSNVIKAIADEGCSTSVTLYPMRGLDGTPKEGFDDEE